MTCLRTLQRLQKFFAERKTCPMIPDEFYLPTKMKSILADKPIQLLSLTQINGIGAERLSMCGRFTQYQLPSA